MTKRPTVAVLRTNPKDSALTRVLSFLTTGYDVECLVWDRTGDYECPVKHSHLRVRRSRVGGGYHSASALVGVMRLQPWFAVRLFRSRPSVVHAIDLDTGLIGLLAAKIMRVPFVYQCLDPYHLALPPSWPSGLGAVARKLEDFVVARADLFVITDLRRLPQHGPVDRGKVVEIANVPLERHTTTAPSASTFTVGYIGSLAEHRSLPQLIEAVAGLAHDGVALVLGGYGPMERELRVMCDAAPNVSFLGWVPQHEMAGLQARFNVFAIIEDPEHPGYRWTSPNKLFESMAAGRPVLVAEGTLSADHGCESGHGVAVPYGDVDALQEAILALKADPERCAQLGAAGLAAFEGTWAPGRMQHRLLVAYSRLGTSGRAGGDR